MNTQVKLVSMTAPVIEGAESANDLIAFCARVSNPSNQHNHSTSERLLQYLVKHKHWSPFEMADMTVEINTSRGIAAQILRHRSFSFQEFSMRYSNALDQCDLELRMEHETSRQSSTSSVEKDSELYEIAKSSLDAATQAYEKLVEAGVAKECARGILPLNTGTRMYMKGSVRSWIHFCMVRCEETTQKEHRIIANAVRGLLIENFPAVKLIL